MMRHTQPMRWMTCVFLLGLLAGCADNGVSDRIATLNTFIGQPEAVVVRQMGVPTRSYAVGGERYLAYTQSQTDFVPAVPGVWTPYDGWNGGFGGFPPGKVERSCETTFEIDQGVVRTVMLRGNFCQ